MLCDIRGLFNGGTLNGADISDFSFDANTDTILACSEASTIERLSRISRAEGSSNLEHSGEPDSQPDGDQLYTEDEVSEFYRYAVAGASPLRTLTLSAYG